GFWDRLLQNPRLQLISLIIFLLISGISVVAAIDHEIKQPVELESKKYVQSATCIRCHPNHYESWSRTYHRTMTQISGTNSVLGNFDNATYSYNGVVSHFYRDGTNYFIRTVGSDGQERDFPIARTIGSRRIQQYVTRIGDRYMRLPLA